MILYISTIIFPFLLFGIKSKLNTKLFEKILFVFLIFFLCCGYMTGSDWRSYEVFYEELSVDNYFVNLFRFEPLFILFVFIVKNLTGLGFWAFSCIFKILSFTLIYKMIKKYSPQEYFFLSLMVFIATYAYYLYIDCPFRNMLAATIAISSIRYIEKKEFGKFLTCSIVATLFHITAIFMIPAYFIASMKLRGRHYILIYFAILLMLTVSKSLFPLLEKLFANIPFVLNKVEGYQDSDIYGSNASILTVGYVVRIIILLLLVRMRAHFFDRIPHGKIIFNMAYFYLLVTLLSSIIPIFARIELYFMPFYSIAISLITIEFNRHSKLIYICFLLIFCFYSMYSTITSSHKYIPYTNYIVSCLKGEELSFEYRDNYNYRLSPYSQKK